MSCLPIAFEVKKAPETLLTGFQELFNIAGVKL